MAFHLIEACSKLLDEFIKRGELNIGLGHFRLGGDNGFAGLGVLAQDFHAERHSGRGHDVEALYCFLRHKQIRVRCFKKVLRDPSFDTQFCRAAGDVSQGAHVRGDDAVLLR
jgi:hypothetical protein